MDATSRPMLCKKWLYLDIVEGAYGKIALLSGELCR